MNAGEIVSRTLTLWRENLLVFAAIVAVVAIPLAVIGPAQEAATDGAPVASAATIVLVWFVISALANIALQVSTIFAGGSLHLGSNPSVAAAYKHARSRIVTIAVADIVLAVAMFLMAITIIGIPFAIYFGVRWSLYATCITLEDDVGPFQGFSRSTDLVRGSWWRVLGISILIGLLGLLFAIPALVLTIILAVFSEGAVLGWVVSTISSFLWTLVGTFWTVGQVVLYFDLRHRHGESVEGVSLPRS